MPAHYPRTCVASTCGRATSRAYFLAENARCFDLSRVAATRTSLVPSLPFSLASRGEMCPVRRSDRRAAPLLHSAVGRWRKRERERERERKRRGRARATGKEPLVMIRPLTLTPRLGRELVAPGRWSPLIHESRTALLHHLAFLLSFSYLPASVEAPSSLPSV